MEVVLKWRTCEENAVSGIEDTQSLRNLRILILELVSFINDEVLPFELLEGSHAEANTLKSCEADIELARMKIFLQDALTLLLGGN